MQILNPNFELESFFQQVALSHSRALLLDYDGTLAPFQQERDQALPYAGVREILSKILCLPDTRLVMITGRRVQDLLPFLGLPSSPEIWGSHGIERLQPDGSYEVAELPEVPVKKTLREFRAWLGEVGLGAQTESKPGALALHWRGVPESGQAKIRQRVLAEWEQASRDAGLELREFDGGIELRVADVNKGLAINTVLAEMASDTVSAYLGDDYTDEDAFEAIKGRGVGVLVREQLRDTAADIWLTPPDELLTFLRDWQQACCE